jgi:thioredoxin reductase
MSISQHSSDTAQDVAVQRCDVCIVGAGIAGLNALFAASRYLSRDQRVILIDRRRRVGGMWVDTYPYVRLHQPHPMFTAGNIKWTLGKDPGYLATKGEVLDHFEYCLRLIKERVQVDEYFGWDFQSHDEVDGVVRITCASPDGELRVIEAKRLIKAYGLRVTPNDPLQISSDRVHSVSPDYCDVRSGDIQASDSPVWIIGGGKTAMDTAHTLITAYPGRKVYMVAGRGTFFNSRDRMFPSGSRRWWTGTPTLEMGAQLSRRFDGTNEAEVQQWFRSKFGTCLTPDAANYVAGVLSEAENTTIANGLTDLVMDYFVDAVDRNGATEVTFRSGSSKTIEPGSWIVNCTGYLGVEDNRHPYEPYVSESGAVVSIQPRSATLHLSSFMGYFLTHLLFLDKLRVLPLYEVDLQDLREKSSLVFPYALFTLVGYNFGLMYESLPRAVFKDNGLDYDAWYPLPRRLPGLAKYALTQRRSRERARQALDTVRERFDVRCGPLAPKGG